MVAATRADQILGDLYKEWFLKENRGDKIYEALRSILAQDRDQVTKVSECFEAFWKEYSNEHLAQVLKDFPKVENALYGLLRKNGERYRDHYVHMFNNFVFGGQILSRIASQCSDDEFEELFKVQPENNWLPTVFRKPYTARERLFFIWTLITNFHDIAIPLQRLDELKDGLNEYLTHFGEKITSFPLERQASLALETGRYLDILATFFTNGIRPKDYIYDLPEAGNSYVYKALSLAYEKRDQGILAALGLFKNIEDTYFSRLDREQFQVYREKVLKQDVARAALAVALHNLKPKDYPNLFPIKFEKFPITFLFILCDEIQEFYRPEGLSYEPVTKLEDWPSLEVLLGKDRAKFVTKIRLNYERPDAEKIPIILGQAAKYWDKEKREIAPFSAHDVQQAVEKTKSKDLKQQKEGEERLSGWWQEYCTNYWNERRNTIRGKLDLETPIPIRVELAVGVGEPGTRVQTTYELG